MKNLITSDDFTRINNDVYGNPRYVLHFLLLAGTYSDALYLAKKHGGKKFHNSQFGGGVVFQSYSLPHLCDKLNELTGAIK